MQFFLKTKISRQSVLFIVITIVFYSFLQLLGITCPIKFLTGISCPGCGMTRAWFSCLFLHSFDKAFAYHPLFFLVPLVGVVFLYKSKIPKKIYPFILTCIILLFLGVYIYRMFDPNDSIVVFSPKDSQIYKCLSFVAKTIMEVL